MVCWLWACLCGISWFCLFSSCAFGWCCLHCRSTLTSAHGTSRPPERGFSSCSSPGLTAATYSPLILISTRDANDLLTIKKLIDNRFSTACSCTKRAADTQEKKKRALRAVTVMGWISRVNNSHCTKYAFDVIQTSKVH